VIKFSVMAHKRQGNFTVPRRVLHQLEIGQDEPIHLVVDGDGIHWEGTIELRSGEQVYSRRDEPQTYGLHKIRPYQQLTITASRPKG
jgi:hypothetical protein